MNKKKWEPLFKEGQKQLDAIISTLENGVLKQGYSLMGSGNTGPAILLYYYWLYAKDDSYLEKGNSIILKVFEILKSSNPNVHSLCDGTTGFRWAVNHLISNGFIEGDSDELFLEDDPSLQSVMERDINEGRYDFLHNALGVGLYFLNRNNYESITYVESLISSLERTAEKDNKGLKWSSMYTVSETTKKEVYNLSLSHGMASIIAFLGKAYQADIARDKTKDLLFRAISYVVSQKWDAPDSNSGSFFPSVVFMQEDQPVSGSRLAWCYGDLGLGYALWQASKIIQNAEWEQIAIDVLVHTTTRKDPVKEHVIDAGICHGSAGIAHIYNRLYQHTGMEPFKEATIYWLEDTLNKAAFTDGLAGYKAWHTPLHGGWKNQAGLLEGISGIGLVLLAAVSDIEPKWDECLLLS
jgi:lantibiotic modifying enzyme